MKLANKPVLYIRVVIITSTLQLENRIRFLSHMHENRNSLPSLLVLPARSWNCYSERGDCSQLQDLARNPKSHLNFEFLFPKWFSIHKLFINCMPFGIIQTYDFKHTSKWVVV